MIFVIERYAIHRGSCIIRRLCSSISHNSLSNVVEEPAEFILKQDETLKILRRNEAKALKIAIVGYPNAGKSTLINRLVHRSVCPTSSKVHTTREKVEAVYTEGDTQLIFMDTPGLVAPGNMKKYKLNESFEKDPYISLKKADLVGIIQDASNKYTREKITPTVINLIKIRRVDVPLILILNKVDLVKTKSKLLQTTRMLTTGENAVKFDDVFMVSALTGDGVDDLRNYLLDSAKDSDWQYSDGEYTDQPYEKIVVDTVRAKLLDILPNEIPYKLNVSLEHLEFGVDGSISSVVSVQCPKERIGMYLLKGKARKVKLVAELVEEELRRAFRTSVLVKIAIKFPNKLENRLG